MRKNVGEYLVSTFGIHLKSIIKLNPYIDELNM